MVGRAHRPLVVLDHDHGVAEVAQPLQRLDQLRVVALVQADRGLVEDVEHADQAGADLGRQPDPLRLAAGEGARRARQVEVADADVLEEGEPLVISRTSSRAIACSVSVISSVVDPASAPRAPTAPVYS